MSYHHSVLADLSISRSNSVSSSMMDIVLGARQVRRFIREISLDSQESDIDIETEPDYRDYRDYREHNNNSQHLGSFCDNTNTYKSVEITDTDITGEEFRDSDGEPRLKKESSVPDFKLIERKTGINRRLWKLTGFSDKESLNLSEFSDADNASMVSFYNFQNISCLTTESISGVGEPGPRLGQSQPPVAQCECEGGGGTGVGQRVLRRVPQQGGPGRLLPAVAEGPGVLSPHPSQPVPQPGLLPALLHRLRGAVHDEVPALRQVVGRRPGGGRHPILGLHQPLGSEVQVPKQHFKVNSWTFQFVCFNENI